MSKKYLFLFNVVVVTLLSIAEFFIFPNLYSTIILFLIIIFSFYLYIYVIKEEAKKKEEVDYFHLVIHELKNPLSTIKLSLKMLTEGNFGMLNSQQQDILEETSKKNELSIRLVEDLLDYSKAEMESKYKKDLVDVLGIIEKIIEHKKEEIKDKRIAISFKKPGKILHQIIADKNKITVVIQNLIDNALHYTPMGGTIEITLNQDDRFCQFMISDSGIGIPEDQQSKIFTKFFRASNAIKTEVPGSGLGLFIVKKFIDGHHGKVWFTSKEHEGSKFYFKIPV